MNILLVLALSLDTFFACMALGAKKIEIPFISKLIIALVSSFFLTLSLTFGNILTLFVNQKTLDIIGFLVLFILATVNIFDSLFKKFIQKHIFLTHSINIKYLTLTLNIYIDKTKADKDKSLSLNPAEALVLSILLSMDSLFTGISIQTNILNGIFLVSLSVVLGIISSVLGIYLGRKLQTQEKDYSYISGIILLFLSFNKLL